MPSLLRSLPDRADDDRRPACGVSAAGLERLVCAERHGADGHRQAERRAAQGRRQRRLTRSRLDDLGSAAADDEEMSAVYLQAVRAGRDREVRGALLAEKKSRRSSLAGAGSESKGQAMIRKRALLLSLAASAIPAACPGRAARRKPIPTSRSRSSSRSRPAGRWTPSRAPSASRCRRGSASRWWSRTAPARAPPSAPRRSPAPSPTADPAVGHAVDGRDRAGALQGPRLRSEGASPGRPGRGISERRGDPAEPAGQHAWRSSSPMPKPIAAR